MRNAHICSHYLILAVEDEIFVVDLQAPHALRGTHRAARNSASAAQKISSVRHRPSSQSFCQAVYPVCDPAAISAGPSLTSSLPKTGHFPTHSCDQCKDCRNSLFALSGFRILDCLLLLFLWVLHVESIVTSSSLQPPHLHCEKYFLMFSSPIEHRLLWPLPSLTTPKAVAHTLL